MVYFNDAVTESILRIPAGDLEGGDYTIVLQGMGGATQKLLVYLRVSGGREGGQAWVLVRVYEDADTVWTGQCVDVVAPGGIIFPCQY